MIEVSRIVPLMLEACPGAEQAWRDHVAWWDGETAGHYNDISVFAHHAVDSFEAGRTEEFDAVFACIERLIVEGTGEARDVAVVGFLEDVQNIASWRPFGAKAFRPWLGPRSAQEWDALAVLWREHGSLANIVRHESHQRDSWFKRIAGYLVKR